MYTLSCVEKYVADHAGQFGEAAVGVLQRARSCSIRGAIPESLIQSILGDALLAEEFDRLVTNDPGYIRLVAEATQALTRPPESP
ncbi:MAG: hypothetical protein WC734_02390 [Patescibacteria group bacterium]|jgi:hypothetical protein